MFIEPAPNRVVQTGQTGDRREAIVTHTTHVINVTTKVLDNRLRTRELLTKATIHSCKYLLCLMLTAPAQ